MNILFVKYLTEVFKDKWLRAIFLIYAAGMIYFPLHSKEEFPFLLYGMYSLKEKGQEEYMSYSLVADGKPITGAAQKDAAHELTTSFCDRALPLAHEGNISEHDLIRMREWLMRYLQAKQLNVYAQRCVYNKEGKPQIVQRELLFE